VSSAGWRFLFVLFLQKIKKKECTLTQTSSDFLRLTGVSPPMPYAPRASNQTNSHCGFMREVRGFVKMQHTSKVALGLGAGSIWRLRSVRMVTSK
jgi:hypothetical protein